MWRPFHLRSRHRKPEPRLAVRQLRFADQCGKAGGNIEIELA
jgi:hypothetical protein